MVFLLLPTFFFICLSSILLLATFRFKSRVAYLLGFFLLSTANMVLAIEISSLFKQITLLFVLGIHILLLILSGFHWYRSGKPRLFVPFDGNWANLNFLPPFKNYPEIYLFGVVVGVVYLIGAWLIVATPQNNFDSMTYHLSRVGYWLQHKSLYPWASPSPRQTSFPYNAEIGVLWTVLFWGTDQLSGFVQWFSALFTAVSVYGMARLLNAGRGQAVMSAFFMLSLPEVFLQSVTTMNDLVTASFLGSGVFFLLFGWRSNQKNHFILSGLAFALALGTKVTVYFFVPGMLVLLIVLVIFNRQEFLSNITYLLLGGSIAFLLFGSFSFIQNYLFDGNILPAPQTVALTLTGSMNPNSRWQKIGENLSLYTIQAVDISSLPSGIRDILYQAKIDLLQPIINDLQYFQTNNWSNYRNSLASILYQQPVIHEDLVWFGPILLFMFFPLLIVHVNNGYRYKKPYRLGLVFLVILFSITMAAILSWSPYIGRYITLVVPFISALIYPWFNSHGIRKWLQWIIVAISIVCLYQTLMFNQAKPLIGPNAIWNKSAFDIRLINNSSYRDTIAKIQSTVPENGVLATRLGQNAWDYLLFGKKFQRKIVPLDPNEDYIDVEWLKTHKIDYLLIEARERPFLSPPEGLDLIWLQDGWSLFQICESPHLCELELGEAYALSGETDSKNFIRVSPESVGKIGVLELETIGWGIEQVDGKGLYWLGEGWYQNLKIHIWSEYNQKVLITIDAVAGPGRMDLKRTVRLIYRPREGIKFVLPKAKMVDTSFNGVAKLSYEIDFLQGFNLIDIYSLDTAEIREQPNGDMRPLLILLRDILLEVQ